MTSTLLYLFTSLFLLYMTTPLSKNFSLPFPSPQDIRMKASEAVRDIAFLSLGMRRLGADVEFIQLMQYYGTSEEEQEHHRHDLKYGAGNYPEFFVRARHILDLDPYYRNACLYAAGVLAF
ncbi:MAG: hypothetical protein HY399_02255, partial [Elusimicrobia bacterium]|nr:hypothetical protein [Elusimicrobiota bacterium]